MPHTNPELSDKIAKDFATSIHAHSARLFSNCDDEEIQGLKKGENPPALLQFYKQVTSHIIHHVLSEKASPALRAERLLFWVKVAKNLFNHGNHFMTACINYAIMSTDILNLKATQYEYEKLYTNSEVGKFIPLMMDFYLTENKKLYAKVEGNCCSIPFFATYIHTFAGLSGDMIPGENTKALMGQNFTSDDPNQSLIEKLEYLRDLIDPAETSHQEKTIINAITQPTKTIDPETVEPRRIRKSISNAPLQSLVLSGQLTLDQALEINTSNKKNISNGLSAFGVEHTKSMTHEILHFEDHEKQIRYRALIKNPLIRAISLSHILQSKLGRSTKEKIGKLNDLLSIYEPGSNIRKKNKSVSAKELRRKLKAINITDVTDDEIKQIIQISGMTFKDAKSRHNKDKKIIDLNEIKKYLTNFKSITDNKDQLTAAQYEDFKTLIKEHLQNQALLTCIREISDAKKSRLSDTASAILAIANGTERPSTNRSNITEVIDADEAFERIETLRDIVSSLSKKQSLNHLNTLIDSIRLSTTNIESALKNFTEEDDVTPILDELDDLDNNYHEYISEITRSESLFSKKEQKKLTEKVSFADNYINIVFFHKIKSLKQTNIQAFYTKYDSYLKSEQPPKQDVAEIYRDPYSDSAASNPISGNQRNSNRRATTSAPKPTAKRAARKKHQTNHPSTSQYTLNDTPDTNQVSSTNNNSNHRATTLLMLTGIGIAAYSYYTFSRTPAVLVAMFLSKCILDTLSPRTSTTDTDTDTNNTSSNTHGFFSSSSQTSPETNHSNNDSPHSP